MKKYGFGYSTFSKRTVNAGGVSPVNIVAPSLTRVGNSMVCNKGSWTGTPTIVYSYVFIRSNDGGVNFTVVQSSASDTYNLAIGDNLALIRCNVLGNNGIGGNVLASSNDLNVGQLLPVNSVAPGISGNRFVSQTLSGTDGTWTNAVSYSYQWQRSTDGGTSWSDISGATSATYVAAVADMTNRVRRRVRATNAFGSTDAFSGNLQIQYTLLDGYSNAAYAIDLRLQRGAYFGSNIVEIVKTSDSSLLNIGHDANGEIDIAAAIAHAGGVNRLIQSQNFTTTWGILSSIIVSTNNVAPDNTNTATIMESTSGFGVLLQQTEQTSLIPSASIVNPSGTYVASIYVKKVSNAAIRISDASLSRIYSFNMDSPAANGAVGGNFETLANGWFRIWMTFTGAQLASGFRVSTNTSSVNQQYLLWGAQINLGSIPTTYTPTTTNPSGFARVRTYYDQSTNGRHAVNSTLSNQDFIVVDGQSIIEEGQVVTERYDSTHGGLFSYAFTSFNAGANSTVYDKNKRLTNQYNTLSSPNHYEHATQGIGFSDPSTYNNLLSVSLLYKVAIFNRAFPNGQVFRRNVVSGTWDSGTAVSNLANSTAAINGIRRDFFNTSGRARLRATIIFIASHDLATMQAISLLI